MDGHELDPLFVQAAQTQADQIARRQAEKAAAEARRYAEEKSAEAWDAVLRFQWSSEGVTEAESHALVSLIQDGVAKSLAAGKSSQLRLFAEFIDDENLRVDCRLASKLITMVLEFQENAAIAAHIRIIPGTYMLIEGLDWAAENLRTGGPYRTVPNAASAEAISGPPESDLMMTREEIALVSGIGLQTLKNQSARFLGAATVPAIVGRGKKHRWNYLEIRERLERETGRTMPSLAEARQVIASQPAV